MIESLPHAPVPGWLATIAAESMERIAFPLREILQGSLYYPASAFDGDPVAYLNGNFWSFVFVDCGEGEGALDRELEARGFLGYHLLARRNVREAELAPAGWTSPSLLPGDGNPPRHQDLRHQSYCSWLVFERDTTRTSEHGPGRFSLLFLCADGVAAFDALYRSNQCAPGAVAVIQPGTGFGGNWTAFETPGAIFHRYVMGNLAGQPHVLLHGGRGGRAPYNAPCWPEYPRDHGFLGNTSIHVWSRD